MKGFRFRLESVLTLRTWDEERARADLAQALARERRFQNGLDEIDQLIEQSLSSWKTERENGGSAAREVGHWAHLNHLDHSRSDLNEKLQAARKIREEKTARLLECRQQRRVLEKLKERQHDAFQKDLQGRLEREIEDLFNARFGKE